MKGKEIVAMVKKRMVVALKAAKWMAVERRRDHHHPHLVPFVQIQGEGQGSSHVSKEADAGGVEW
jgi:hypothetical protein